MESGLALERGPPGPPLTSSPLGSPLSRVLSLTILPTTLS